MTQAALNLSLARIISQGLVEETAADNPIAAVDNMLALQAQLPSSIPWAINLRVKEPSVSAIDEAFESAELVRSWPMRNNPRHERTGSSLAASGASTSVSRMDALV